MPGQGSRVNGTYNAMAAPGGDLLARELDRMATEGGFKGLRAKVNWLMKSAAGREALVAAGVNLASRSTRATVRRWLDNLRLKPGSGISHANARRIDEAYAARRRQTMAARVRRRLERGGGVFIEVAPPDQGAVARTRRRDLGGVVRIRVLDDTWRGLVAAWAAGDRRDMQRQWEGICDDQLYPPAAFYSCGDIQIAA